MSDDQKKANGTEIKKEVTPGWQEILYNDKRKEMLNKGELNLRDYHAISGPEMLHMAVMGFRMYENGKYTEAKAIFGGLVALEPTEPYYHTALGAVYLAEEDLEMARFHFSQAIVLNPKEIAPYVNRGEVNLREGKVMEAAEDFAQAVKLDPQFKDPLTQRARVLAAAALEMLDAGGNEAAKKAKADLLAKEGK